LEEEALFKGGAPPVSPKPPNNLLVGKKGNGIFPRGGGEPINPFLTGKQEEKRKD